MHRKGCSVEFYVHLSTYANTTLASPGFCKWVLHQHMPDGVYVLPSLSLSCLRM